MKNYKMPAGQLTSPQKIRKLFSLCWISYVFAYLGRLNYAACLVEITRTEGWTKSEAGLIATGFFIFYGLGQLVNGYLGDRISPKLMVGIGLSLSGLINLIFPFFHAIPIIMLLWCINGFVQSMIWSPLVRMISERMPCEKRQQACVNMNSTVPVGTLAVYGLSALLVYLGDWQLVFFSSGTLLLTMSVVWFRGISSLEKGLEPVVSQAHKAQETAPAAKVPVGKLVILSALPLCLAGLMMQGMLKDGVTTWIPTFLEENFGLTAAASILCTTIVPIINLGGVYLGSWANRRFFKNEVLTAFVFFLTALGSLLLLTFYPLHSAVFSLLLLTVTTTFMMGINTVLASMMPSYYVQYGVCSTITGLLNGSAYVGSAFSSYGSGAVVQYFGWNTILYCWCICAAAGALFCSFCFKKWGRFRNYSLYKHP